MNEILVFKPDCGLLLENVDFQLRVRLLAQRYYLLVRWIVVPGARGLGVWKAKYGAHRPLMLSYEVVRPRSASYDLASMLLDYRHRHGLILLKGLGTLWMKDSLDHYENTHNATPFAIVDLTTEQLRHCVDFRSSFGPAMDSYSFGNACFIFAARNYLFTKPGP